jgi:ABC-type phosphate transport system substrate-binding protein
MKSANQLYKESGTTLSFRDWIEREKSKGIHIPNVEANNEMLNLLGDEKNEEPKSNKQLVRNVLFVVGALALAYVGYRYVKSKNAQ